MKTADLGSQLRHWATKARALGPEPEYRLTRYGGSWCARSGEKTQYGPTADIAIDRCLVALRFGDEVAVTHRSPD